MRIFNTVTYLTLTKLFTVLFAVCIHILANAQTDCDNMGFEDGNLDEWVSGRGCNENGVPWQGRGECHDRQDPLYQTCCPAPAPLSRDGDLFDWESRHSIMSGGSDPYGAFELIAPQLKGYPPSNYSLRLGNARPWGQADQVERTFTVDETNAIFAYQFAFVLNDPRVNHPDQNLPFFEAGLYDSNDRKIECTYLKVLANDTKFDSVIVDSVQDNMGQDMVVRFKNWRPVFISLKDYIGQDVTIRFQNADCAQSGHWGYSYVTAYCGQYKPMEDTTICPGDSVTLTSPYPIEGFELLWSTGDTTETITVNPDVTTTITLTATNRVPFDGIVGNCVSEETVTITVGGAAHTTINDTICPGESAELHVEPAGSTYDWYETATGGTPIHTGDVYNTPPLSQNKTYYVQNNTECATDERVPVEVIISPNPIAAFTPNPFKASIDNPVFTFMDQSEGAITGTWYFGDGDSEDYVPGINPRHSYFATNQEEGPFKYNVKLAVENEFGCKDSIVIPVEIENIWTIYVPNSFTPNGDGVNDLFKAYGIGIMEFKMLIFDRWGELVYKSEDINEGWDGTPISGSSTKQDIYVWKIRILNNKGEVKKYIGHVGLYE